MKNLEIRQKAKEKGVLLWEVADTLKISEATMTRKLRKELPPKKKAKFLRLSKKWQKKKTTVNGLAVLQRSYNVLRLYKIVFITLYSRNKKNQCI